MLQCHTGHPTWDRPGCAQRAQCALAQGVAKGLKLGFLETLVVDEARHEAFTRDRIKPHTSMSQPHLHHSSEPSFTCARVAAVFATGQSRAGQQTVPAGAQGTLSRTEAAVRTNAHAGCMESYEPYGSCALLRCDFTSYPAPAFGLIARRRRHRRMAGVNRCRSCTCSEPPRSYLQEACLEESAQIPCSLSPEAGGDFGECFSRASAMRMNTKRAQKAARHLCTQAQAQAQAPDADCLLCRSQKGVPGVSAEIRQYFCPLPNAARHPLASRTAAFRAGTTHGERTECTALPTRKQDALHSQRGRLTVSVTHSRVMRHGLQECRRRRRRRRRRRLPRWPAVVMVGSC